MMGRTVGVLALARMQPLKILATTVGVALLVWGLLFAYLSSPAWAATITVNSLADDADGTDGDCTLREAIISANTDTRSGTAAGECAAGSGEDLIDIGVMGTVNLTGALPNLASNIAIEGPGADKFTVRRDTGGDYRIFTVACCISEVSISEITITNGKSVGFDRSGDGGGISNHGTLTVTNSTISANTAPRSGGGISSPSRLTVTNSTISGNTSTGPGGGISTLGTLTVTGSTISGNTSGNSGGGGIWSNASDESLATTITNSTISGNTSTGPGGGVYNYAGLTVIEFSTITNNTAPNDRGSGVYEAVWFHANSTEVLSSIISANQGTDVDSAGLATNNSFVSRGYNLIGDGNATGAFNQTGDQTAVSDPKLDLLGSYGGPTQTHRLRSDSLAIDAGPPSTSCPPPETDQRGVERPQDGDADSTPICDIGSFERKKPDTQMPKVMRTFPANGATLIAPGVNVTATFSEAMDARTTDGDPSTINGTTFKLFRAGTITKIGAAVSYDATSKKAKLNPNANLQLGTKYNAVVTTGAEDLAGNRLDQNPSLSGLQQKAWTFTIRN